MTNFLENLAINLLIIGFVIFFLFITIYIIVSADTAQKCLLLGWKSSAVTWNFQRYCSREENEFEITKPLEEIRKNNEK
jgi:hypothetical protein